MVKLLFGSIIRDGESYLQRYFDQLTTLTSDYKVGLAITEGDSIDNTYAKIFELCPSEIDLYTFKYNHNGPKFGSVSNPTRWLNIAITWNYMLDNLREVVEDYDYFIYMESDLIWDKATISKLITGLQSNRIDAIAPMSMLGEIFYDTWGHRAFDVKFGALYPYHYKYLDYGRYMPLTSAGSCIAMKPEVINTCRLSLVDAMIGHDIVKNNYVFMLDKESKVQHP